MGIVVTVMNMKGGVGKTTVSTHLAGLLGRYSVQKKTRKILAIDYDPQFNMSQTFLAPKTYFQLEKDRKTTLSILLDDDGDLNPYQLQVPGNHNPPDVTKLATRLYNNASDKNGYLDLIPSTLDLMYVALGQANTQTKPIEERFRKFIEQCRKHYDIIIIDCHPAGSLFTKTSLRNSDHVLIPVIPQRYALLGIGLMLQFISSKNVGDVEPTPHILFNMTPRVGTEAQENTIRSHATFSKYCMDSKFTKYKAFSEPDGGKGFVWVSGKPYSTEAFANLFEVANEFVDRIEV